jgi:hypothetical protein
MKVPGPSLNYDEIPVKKGSKKSINLTNVDDETVDLYEVDIESENDGQLDKAPYNMCYATYCLLVLTCSMVSNTWGRNAMSTFYGYGVEGLK